MTCTRFTRFYTLGSNARTSHPLRPTALRAATILAVSATLSCNNAPENAQPEVTRSPAPNADTTSADAIFLRALGNHQAGLMFLAHVADQHHDSVSVRAEALAVDDHHHRQTDSAMATFRELTGRDFLPTVSDHYQSLVADLQRLPAPEFDSRFWTEVADHHREGIVLIDSSLARLRDPRVITLARNVRAQHAKELTALDSSAQARRARPQKQR